MYTFADSVHNKSTKSSEVYTMENDKKDRKDEAEKTDSIVKTGETEPSNSKHLIHCLTVIGQIEGHYVLPEQNKTTKYEHIIHSLVAIEQDRSVEGLLIILNTVGGDVEAGLAIAIGDEDSYGISCGGRRSLYRSSSCSKRKEVFYSSVGIYDHTSRKDERHPYRRTPDILVF